MSGGEKIDEYIEEIICRNWSGSSIYHFCDKLVVTVLFSLVYSRGVEPTWPHGPDESVCEPDWNQPFVLWAMPVMLGRAMCCMKHVSALLWGFCCIQHWRVRLRRGLHVMPHQTSFLCWLWDWSRSRHAGTRAQDWSTGVFSFILHPRHSVLYAVLSLVHMLCAEQTPGLACAPHSVGSWTGTACCMWHRGLAQGTCCLQHPARLVLHTGSGMA